MGVSETDCVGVCEGDSDGVFDAEGLCEPVSVVVKDADCERVGVCDGLRVGETDAVELNVGETDAVQLKVWVAVKVGLAVGDEDGVTVVDTLGVGVAYASIGMGTRMGAALVTLPRV